MRNLSPNSQNENQENREEGPCSPLPFLPPPPFTEQFNSDEEHQQAEVDHNNENILNHTNRVKQVPINGENKNQNWFDETKILITDRFEQLKKQCEEAFGTKKFKEGLVASQILKEKYSKNQQQMQNQQEQLQPEISSSQQKAYLKHIAQLSCIQQENSQLFVDVPLKGKTVAIPKAIVEHYSNYFKQKKDQRDSDLQQNVKIEQAQQQQQEQLQQQQQMPELKENNPKSKRKQNNNKKNKKYAEEEHIVFSEQIKTIMEVLRQID